MLAAKQKVLQGQNTVFKCMKKYLHIFNSAAVYVY